MVWAVHLTSKNLRDVIGIKSIELDSILELQLLMGVLVYAEDEVLIACYVLTLQLLHQQRSFQDTSYNKNMEWCFQI